MINRELGFSGKVEISKSNSSRELYNHQTEAIKALNKTNKMPIYKGLLVIPTGGGKTFTSVYWVMNQVINKGKKVLWLAHRHELLNQTLDTVIYKASFKDIVPDRKSFRYRIISGMHDRPVNISDDDDFIIASKDSLNRGSEYFEKWVQANQDNICVVIDEAHHAIAKTYRNIINIVERYSEKYIRIIGLTATPTRTSENEKGLLKKVFKNDICYSVDLNTLIAEGILSKPVFTTIETHVGIKKELTAKDLEFIKRAGLLPEKIAKEIVSNKERNNLIVEEYLKNKDKYGKTLIFAINVDHAIALNALFKERGIKSEFVVSSLKDKATMVTISNEENALRIKAFRDGKIDVLINVNILTEGTDIPNVQTVFLTRQTTSTILLNQMIGRGLRGINAGGTEKAYIVSFIDEWKYRINWVSPKSLPEYGQFTDSNINKKKREQELIDIRLIEDFAKYMDKTVISKNQGNAKFEEFSVVGAYVFTIDDEAYDVERTCEVIIFEHLKAVYKEFIDDLDYIFKKFEVLYELEEEKLYEMLLPYIKKEYFLGYDLSFGYNEDDIKDIVLYYEVTDSKPVFTSIEAEKTIYVDTNEIQKPIVKRDEFDFEKMSMSQIREIDETYWRKLRDQVFEKHKDEEGYYVSATKGYKSKSKRYFHIDHIDAISKGGKTVIENLQLLARWENWIKSDKQSMEHLSIASDKIYVDYLDIPSDKLPVDHLDNLEELLRYNFFETDDMERSKKIIDKILKNDKDNISALNAMGTIKNLEGKYTAAITYANKVLKIDEFNAYAFGTKGVAYIHKENYKEAIKSLESSVKYYEDLFFIKLLGDCYKKLNKKDIALYYYNRALEEQEELQHLDEERLADIYFNVASIYFSKRKYEISRSFYEKYLEMYPNDDYVVNSIGVCHERIGNLEQAIECYKRATELNPQDKLYKDNIKCVEEKLKK